MAHFPAVPGGLGARSTEAESAHLRNRRPADHSRKGRSGKWLFDANRDIECQFRKTFILDGVPSFRARQSLFDLPEPYKKEEELQGELKCKL